MSKLSGSYADLITDALEKPRDIAVDPKKGCVTLVEESNVWIKSNCFGFPSFLVISFGLIPEERL